MITTVTIDDSRPEAKALDDSKHIYNRSFINFGILLADK